MSFLPTPDPDNEQEVWLAVTLIGNFARSGTEWVFIGALLLLIIYLVGRLVISTARYVIATYSERLKETGDHVRIFRWALYGALALALIGVLVLFSGQPDATLEGMSILASTFCIFSLFTVIYDWWLARTAKQNDPTLLGDVTVSDILKMKQTIKAARQNETQAKV